MPSDTQSAPSARSARTRAGRQRRPEPLAALPRPDAEPVEVRRPPPADPACTGSGADDPAEPPGVVQRTPPALARAGGVGVGRRVGVREAGADRGGVGARVELAHPGLGGDGRGRLLRDEPLPAGAVRGEAERGHLGGVQQAERLGVHPGEPVPRAGVGAQQRRDGLGRADRQQHRRPGAVTRLARVRGGAPHEQHRVAVGVHLGGVPAAALVQQERVARPALRQRERPGRPGGRGRPGRSGGRGRPGRPRGRRRPGPPGGRRRPGRRGARGQPRRPRHGRQPRRGARAGAVRVLRGAVGRVADARHRCAAAEASATGVSAGVPWGARSDAFGFASTPASLRCCGVIGAGAPVSGS